MKEPLTALAKTEALLVLTASGNQIETENLFIICTTLLLYIILNSSTDLLPSCIRPSHILCTNSYSELSTSSKFFSLDKNKSPSLYGLLDYGRQLYVLRS